MQCMYVHKIMYYTAVHSAAIQQAASHHHHRRFNYIIWFGSYIACYPLFNAFDLLMEGMMFMMLFNRVVVRWLYNILIHIHHTTSSQLSSAATVSREACTMLSIRSLSADEYACVRFEHQLKAQYLQQLESAKYDIKFMKMKSESLFIFFLFYSQHQN